MSIDNSKYGISNEDIRRAALGDFDDFDIATNAFAAVKNEKAEKQQVNDQKISEVASVLSEKAVLMENVAAPENKEEQAEGFNLDFSAFEEKKMSFRRKKNKNKNKK